MSEATAIEDMLGLSSETVLVGPEGDVALTLRRLSIKQQVEIGKMNFDTGSEACLAEVYAAASRGGYQGSKDDLMELLEGDDLLRCEEAMWKLRPLARKRAAAAQAAAQRVNPEALRVLIAMLQDKAEAEPPATSGD
jgi:hypothetical protein